MNEIVLASASLGRKKLFREYFEHFIVSVSGIDESKIKQQDPLELTKRLAFLKAADVSKTYSSDYVVGFDTIVLCGDAVLGKPKDKKEAMDTLKFLRGKEQSVISGFAIINARKKIEINECEVTRLHFRDLTDEFIADYVERNPVTRFAGGYGVQENDDFIDIIEGDRDNVVGAPMKKVITYLRHFGLGKYLKK